MKNTFSNLGAILVNSKFIDFSIINQTLEEIKNYDWQPVWADKRYAGEHWMTCPLIEEYQKTPNYNLFILASIVEKEMKCRVKNLMFYAMLPGGDIPPHRDMVGNVGFGGLRLHVPIITNDKVNFIVDSKKVNMGVGELWALDTSYMHSVTNFGPTNRIHLVMDVIVNEWVENLLPPKNWRFYLHQIHLILLGFIRIFKYLFSKDMRMKDFLSVIYSSIKLKIFKK
jgi:hypothetical protein